MKAIFCIAASLCTLCVVSIAQDGNFSVHFDRGSSTLNPQSKKVLATWYNELGLKKVRHLAISGHTDSDGSQAYNHQLSIDRTHAVCHYLSSIGFDSTKLVVSSHGENLPISKNDTDHGKMVNRRVEISPVFHALSYSDSKEDHHVEVQSFKFSASETIRFTGKEGTEIEIGSGVLVHEDGSAPLGLVQIELTEYIQRSDFILDGLHTQSGSELLETGGTILIEAFNQGQKLRIKDGAEFGVRFASQVEGDGMQLFNGVHENETMDWQASRRGAYRGFIGRSFRPAGWQPFGLMDRLKFVQRVDDRLFDIIPNKEFRTDSFLLYDLEYEYGELAKVQSLMMGSTQMGWINCDRFIEEQEKTVISAIVDTSYHANVFLVFTDIKSIMNSDNWYDTDFQYHFNNVPNDRAAKLVAISIVDEVPYYAMQDVIIGVDDYVALEMQQSTMSDLKMAMRGLD